MKSWKLYFPQSPHMIYNDQLIKAGNHRPECLTTIVLVAQLNYPFWAFIINLLDAYFLNSSISRWRNSVGNINSNNILN